MNDRVNKLAAQAFAELAARGWNMETDPFNKFTDKFAELIVKECADAADMAQEANCRYAGDYVAEQLGFGTEEGVTTWRAKTQ